MPDILLRHNILNLDLVETENANPIQVDFESGIGLFAPVINSLKFINSLDVSWMENESLADNQAETYFKNVCYNQLVNTNETRQIQWHTIEPNHVVQILDRTGSVIGTGTSVEKVADVTRVDQEGDVEFDIWQCDLLFDTPGIQRVRIQALDAGMVLQEEIYSEWINVGTHINTHLIEFWNYQNTEDNVWTNNFTANVRVVSQLWKRQPGSTRTFFRDSKGKPTVLSQRWMRHITLDIYQIPPFLLEQLSAGFALSSIGIDGQQYVSEEGMDEPTYSERYQLANTSIKLETTNNFRQVV